MKRDWARILLIGGAVLVIQSLFWEYARMQPDNSYLVEPWSYRGFESIHGVIFAVIGAALLAAGAAVSSAATLEPKNSFLTVGGIAIAGAVLAGVFAGDKSVSLAGDSLGAAVLGLGVGFGLYLLGQRVYEARSDTESMRLFRGLSGLALKIISLVVGFFLVTTILGSDTSMPAWLGVLIIMTVIGLFVSVMKEPSMAANRMLIATSLVAGTTIGLSGAAIRSTLVRFQAEGGNIPGQYRDTQVTWGYFLANIGVVVFFMGAVMLWARRRDIVQSRQRAAKQREAAEASARELAAAG